MGFSSPSSDVKIYRSAIHLDEADECMDAPILSPDERSEVIYQLIDWLVNEDICIAPNRILDNFQNRRHVLRALLNIRNPKPLDVHFLRQLNRLLQTEVREKEIVDVHALAPVAQTIPGLKGKNGEKRVLWLGDITCLKIDAIVNAANSQLLGCFHPLHSCIDNAIHSAAGPRLREDCHSITQIQGMPEETGNAKITRAYNLPAKFVLHTVGPNVPRGGTLGHEQRAQLAACYVSCLELAASIESIRSIAFCAISTGLFGFPKKEAAEIAVCTVNDWIDKHPNRFDQILYCVFNEEDYREYVRVFQGK